MGADLKTVLHKLIKTVEAYLPEVRGSIFLVDPKFKGELDLDVLQRGEAAAKRAGEMIEQLMHFSRSESSLALQPVQIKKVLQGTIEMGRKTFDKNIALIDKIAKNLPLVSGDENQLEQIFLNLLLNARDALEVSQQPAPSIEMEVNTVSYQEGELVHRPDVSPGDYICIRLTDDGVGMDEETRAHIFEPFFTTKEVGKGTGLGLATAYGIVTEHKGWIECDSQLGVGTTFSVYLPVSEREDLPLESESSEDLPQGTETILIVEDESESSR
jgi:signal transduction histidine kinase